MKVEMIPPPMDVSNVQVTMSMAEARLLLEQVKQVWTPDLVLPPMLFNFVAALREQGV